MRKNLKKVENVILAIVIKNFRMKLQEMREEIDEIDRKIIKLLERRFQIVNEIAKLKRELGLRIEDNEREASIIENCKKSSKELDEEFIEELMRLVISHSKKIQEEKR